MKVTPIARTMTATALTNPDPAFVSLCTGPANQTPFHAVRSDDSIPAADVNLEDTMKIKKSKAASAVIVAERGHSVMQFAFDKNVFKTAEDVTTFLDEGGYQAYTVAETAKSFEVTDNSGTRFEVGSTEVVRNAVPGVTAYIAKLSNEDSDTQVVDDGDETPAPAVVARARTRSAPDATTETPATPEVAEPEAVAAEPVAEPVANVVEAPVVEAEVQPVAETEAEAAITAAVAKCDAALVGLPVTTRKAMSGYVVADVATAINSLRYIIMDADYTGIDDATVALLKASAVNAVDAMVALANQLKTEMQTVFRADAETIKRSDDTTAPEAAPAAVEAVTEPEPAMTVADVTRMIADAVAPLSTEVATLTERATTAEAALSEERQRADKAEGALAARVEADNARTQTRKAEDDLDPAGSIVTDQNEKKPRARASTRILESFGSRHAR